MSLLFGFLYLLVLHYIGDFVLQSYSMSVNKSKSNKALGTHVGIYTVVLFIGSPPLAIGLMIPNGQLVIFWVLGNGLAHFATDYVTSRINARLWAAKRVHGFFVSIGADQLIHSLTLGLSLAWVCSL